MSDLHNLSSPIEDSPEEVLRKKTEIKTSQKQKTIEDINRFFSEYKQKYLKKLFISLGIAVTVCAILLWGISAILGNKSAPIDTAPETAETDSPAPTEAVKFIKFEGHQYYFYVPESYSFLNRTRNDDLNEIVFSDEDNNTVFTLREFEADNHNEKTLDSIYSYIATTVPPSESGETKIGENTFKRRSYSSCITSETDPPHETGVTQETLCSHPTTYYSILINGIIIIFETKSSQAILEETILSTFTRNVIDRNVLSEEYIYSKTSTIKTKLQARFAFGEPIYIQEKDNVTEIMWNAATHLGINVILGFDANNQMTSAYGTFSTSSLSKFDIRDAANNTDAAIKPFEAYELLIGHSGIQTLILKANPRAIFIINDSIPNNNLWEVTIYSGEENGDILLAEYTVDMEDGKVTKKASQ